MSFPTRGALITALSTELDGLANNADAQSGPLDFGADVIDVLVICKFVGNSASNVDNLKLSYKPQPEDGGLADGPAPEDVYFVGYIRANGTNTVQRTFSLLAAFGGAALPRRGHLRIDNQSGDQLNATGSTVRYQTISSK